MAFRSRVGGSMQIGDLVKARHWGTGYIGLVVSIRPHGEICSVMMNDGSVIDHLVSDLEVIDGSW